jgi:hypothetical protein
MKTKITLSLLLIGLFSLSAVANNGKKTARYHPARMTDEVKSIIENKCFGCHNTDSKNDKAKEDLDFKTFDDLSTMKKISAYKKIGEVLEEKEMPPKKFLDRFPDKDLSADERKALIDWAKKEAESLVKGM